jgi:hypothetical protein
MESIYWYSYNEDLELKKRERLIRFEQAEKIVDRFNDGSNNTDGSDVDVMMKTYVVFRSNERKNFNEIAIDFDGKRKKYEVSLESKRKESVKFDRWYLIIFYAAVFLLYYSSIKENSILHGYLQGYFDIWFDILDQNLSSGVSDENFDFIFNIIILSHFFILAWAPKIIGYFFFKEVNKKYEIKNLAEVKNIIRNFFESEPETFIDYFKSLNYKKVT